MKYFEFNNHDYYAMIAVDENRVIAPDMSIEEACKHVAVKFYVESVAGESVTEVWEEGEPTEISREDALKQFMRTPGDIMPEDEKFFNNVEHGEVILIDGSLV